MSVARPKSRLLLCMLVALATMLLGGAGIAQAASKVSPAYDEFGVPTLIINGTHSFTTETAIENRSASGRDPHSRRFDSERHRRAHVTRHSSRHCFVC